MTRTSPAPTRTTPPRSDNYPITGCKDDGTESFAGATRPRSLGAPLKFVRIGRLNASGSVQDPIDGNDVAATNLTRPMYGLSAVFEVATDSTPATGEPTITGTPAVGETLTAVTTAIMDADGLTTPGYTYQWIRVATDNTETNIASATASSYTLVIDDLGTTIKVKVSFTDDANNAQTLTSVATAVVAAALDTTPPTLVSATVTSLGAGGVLRMTFDETPQRRGLLPAAVLAAITVTVDGVEVNLAAQAAVDGIYVTLQLPPGRKIRSGQAVVITYTDPTSGNDTVALQDTAGNDVATFTTGQNSVPGVTNNSTVAPVAPGAPTGLTATASGSTQIDLSWTAPADNGGRVITGYKIEISPNGTDTWTTHLADTTSADTTYAHTGLAASTTRHYRVSAINTIGTSPASNVDDATTGTGTNNPATGAPTITGTPTVGQTLTAVTTAIMDDDGLTTPGYTYQWIRVATDTTETNIGSATASTYTLVTDDLGATIKVKVSFTDDASNAETLTSVATAAVSADTTPPTLISADVTSLGSGRVVVVTFDERLKRGPSSLVPATVLAAITVTVDGVDIALNPSSMTGSPDIALQLQSPIRQGQTVVITYTDPTAVDDANAIQDFAGNDAASFTTGMNSVPDVTNNSTVAPTAPGAPTGLTATASGTTQIDLSWTAPADNGGRVITGYKIEISPNGTDTWTTHLADTTDANTTYAHTGLAASTTRHYRVSAINTIGTGTASNVDDATTGAGTNTPPTASNGEVTATEDTDYPFTAANFNFADTDAGAALSSVKITSLPASGTGTLAVDGTVIASGALPKAVTKVDIDASKLTYSPPANASGDDYATFQFKVNDGTDDSATASTMTIDVTAVNDAATGQPGITGTAQVGQLLTATVGTIADPDVLPDPFLTDTNTSFQWVRVTSGTDDDISGETASTYTLVTADEGKTIKVKVSFQDGGGGSEGPLTSVATAVVSAPTAPGAPTGLTATASGTTRIDLSWTAPASDGGSAITGYKIEISSDAGNAWTTHLADTTSPNTTYSHTGLAAGTTRHYRVSAINTNGAGAASNVDDATTGTTVPDAPTGLTATASGTTQIDLSWTAPASDGGSAITGYKIEISSDGGNAWTTHLANTTSPATTYEHTGLAASTTRHYRVSAINTNGAGAASNVDGATTGTTVPDAPTGLAATASGNTRINLSWTAPASDGGSPISGYKIEESPNGNSNWTTLEADTNGPATTYSHTGLSAGATRHYRVSAINSNGAGAPSSVDDATTGTTVPGAPTGLTATASGTTRIDLTWTAPASDGGRPITGYKIEESPNGNSNWTTLEANTNATTYAHTGLAGGTTRHYRVSAINSNGAGAPSNVDGATTGTTVPDAPTGLAATASGTTRINLSWTAPGSDGGSPISGYRIEESPSGNSNWTTLEADTNGPATTYSHTGLSGGTTRHYRVSAINSNGAGAPSNVDGATTGTTVPGAPTSLAATASGTTRINLSWTAPASDGGSPISGYKIEESPNGNSSWTVLVATTGGASTTHSDTGLPGGTTRHYRVSAINTNGAGAPSNVAGTTTGTTVPGAPTRLTATASGTARINLSWTAPARDGGTPITGYRIEESPDGTSSWTDLVTDTSDTRTTYSHTGLPGGTTRHYRVSAINSNGAGAPSSVDSATTGTSVPGAPTALSARASGTTQVDLSWTAPGSDGGSPVTGYRIEESPNGRSSWNVLVATTGSPATTYSRTGLASGATRHYRVSAVNTNGAGAPSNTASTTTGTTVPGAPTRLTAAASGTTRINLSWTAPASDGGIRITGYRIESSLGSGSSWTDVVATTGTTGTTYSDTGLSGGTTRHYRVSAINTNGAGAPSNVDGATTGTTVPDAPTDLAARVSGNTQIDLSWARPASDGGSAITGYRIEISSDGGSSWTDRVANTRSPHRAYSHIVAAGATRHYRVSAISAKGTSAHSNVASATTVLRRVRFEADLYTAREGGAAATVAVVLSAAAPAPVTIPLTREHLSGATEADYSGVPAGVTFAAGQARQTFTVTVTEDSDEDGLKRLRLQFGTLPSGYASRPHRTAVVRLVDNDGGLTVGFGTERHTTVQVREHADVRHQFSVYLHTNRYGPPNNNSQHSLTIPLEVQHVGGAEEDVDYTPRIPASVTFAAGQSQASFSIRAIPDGERESGEGLRIDFGPLPSGVARSEWGPYETIAFVDQVLPEYTARFGAAEYTATEGGGGARVTIHLSAEVEIEPAEVRLQVEYGGDATEDDHGSIPTVVTFLVGERTQTITVTATNDTDDDDGESVTLSFLNDPNGRVSTGNGPNSATVALEDNDGAERVTVSFGAATYTATEGGSDATVSVELDAAPGRSVTIPLTKADIGGATQADYSGIPGSVTFGANQTAKTVTVTATAGDGSDGGESVSIGFGTLPESVFAGRPATTTVTLADGSEQTLVVEFDTSRSHTVLVREGGRRKRLRVFLNRNASKPVTIPLVVMHVGGATEADYTGIPESVTIAAGQSEAPYYVQALPDEEDETGEGLRLDFGPLPPGVRKGIWGPYETIEFLDAGAPASANLSVAGRLLTLGYPGALDRGSTPSPRDFVVSAEVPGGEKAMAPVAAVSVRGSDVFLQLARPVLPDETVTLSYLADAMHPIREAAGLPAPPLTDAPVRNDTPASGPGPEAGLPVQAAIPAAMAVLPEEAPVGAQTQRLDLSSRNLTDLSALAGLTGLRELDLRHNAVEDLWPLAGLTGLRVLHLSANRIADLSPLAGLTALEQLSLAGNRIADLRPLAGLTGLERLHLSTNRIGDLSPLAGLSGLQVLDLAGNQIEELWPLSYLTALERLNLSDNRIEELWPLAGLSGLEVLLLDRNRVADLSALSPLAELANLGLSGNRIADLWPLAGLDQLRRLDLSGNAVANLSALGDVSGLVWLRLPGNPVSDVAPLGRLELLLWLWLDSGTAAGMEALAPPAGHGAAHLWIERTPPQ